MEDYRVLNMYRVSLYNTVSSKTIFLRLRRIRASLIPSEKLSYLRSGYWENGEMR